MIQCLRVPFSTDYPRLLSNPTPLVRRFMGLLEDEVPLETLAQRS